MKIYFTFVMVIKILFIACLPFHQMVKAQDSTSRQIDLIEKPAWYFCMLNINNNQTYYIKYFEFYSNDQQPVYKVYSYNNENNLYFSPGSIWFSFYIPSNDVQFHSDVHWQMVRQTLIKRYLYNIYLFHLSQLENESIEAYVQFNEDSLLRVICDYSTGEPSPLRKTERKTHWSLDYAYSSLSSNHCPQTQYRNSLSSGSEVFSFENHIEYPEDFQIPFPLKYNKPFDNYMGVTAYGNKKRGEYQCTELVHRFFKNVYNVPTRIGLGLGHGKDLSLNLTRFSNEHNPTVQIQSQKKIQLKFVFIDNGCSSQLPVPGSSISFSWKTYGHVAIVRAVEKLTENIALLHLFQQHGIMSVLHDTRYLLVKDQHGYWRGKDVVGWSIPIIKQ